jgi:hypothetical protein
MEWLAVKVLKRNSRIRNSHPSPSPFLVSFSGNLRTPPYLGYERRVRIPGLCRAVRDKLDFSYPKYSRTDQNKEAYSLGVLCILPGLEDEEKGVNPFRVNPFDFLVVRRSESNRHGLVAHWILRELPRVSQPPHIIVTN